MTVDRSPVPQPPDELAQVLAYAELTYRTVTQQRRRLAAAALAGASVFAVLTVLAAAQWLSARDRIPRVPDDPLVEALGVTIPDPRPALERAELRLRALVFGWIACSTGLMSLLFVGIWAYLRPPPPSPPALRSPARSP